MAKSMPYVDEAGNSYPESYWRLVQCNLGIADRSGLVTFYGYRSEADRQAGRRMIGMKSYIVSGAGFDALMQRHLTDPAANVMRLAYQIAAETKDVVVDPGDPSRNVSFFEGATDLL